MRMLNRHAEGGVATPTAKRRERTTPDGTPVVLVRRRAVLGVTRAALRVSRAHEALRVAEAEAHDTLTSSRTERQIAADYDEKAREAQLAGRGAEAAAHRRTAAFVWTEVVRMNNEPEMVEYYRALVEVENATRAHHIMELSLRKL